jgi:hypothetical protein
LHEVYKGFVGNALIDRVGQKFGRLTVIKREANDKRGNARWLCLCECGTERIVNSNNLTTGATTSCGCLRNELVSKRTSKRPYESIYNRLCSSATRRNIPVAITYDEYLLFTKYDKCHYCYSPLIWNKYVNVNRNDSAAYNIDRKDNSLGYTKNNCVECCSKCNWSKGDRYTHEDWYGMTGYLRMKKEHIELTEAA